MVPRPVTKIFGSKYLAAVLQTLLFFCLFFLSSVLGIAACICREKGFAALPGEAALFLDELGWIDLLQSAVTAILIWLQIVMSGFFVVLLSRTALADSRHGGLLSFLLFLTVNLLCNEGRQAIDDFVLLSGFPPATWYAFDVIYYLGLGLLFFLLTVFLADRKLSP